MTTSLSQAQTNSPPTRPGWTVLRGDLSAPPGVLVHDLGAGQDTLSARFMFNAAQATGGRVTVAGGIGSDGFGVWRIVLDLDGPQVKLVIDGHEAAGDYAPELGWHTVEVGLDAAANAATLRVDGTERGTISTPFNPTRHAWLGSAFVEAGVTGTIDFDAWVLATEPIGVVRSTPSEDHAADPRRWLVVYNRASRDSAAWAEAYRQRRGVPYANLCGLDLPTDETISAAEYTAMHQQLSDYLSDNHLGAQVVGVLLGLNVPGYTDLASLGSLTPIASYLHTDDSHGPPTINPLYQPEIGARPAASDYATARLTGRVDAASLADALALLDRADAITDDPLVYDGLADFVIDINPDSANVGPVYADPVAAWATGQGLSRLRLPTVIYDQAGPASVSGESCLWGWRDAAPPSGFFDQPIGRRALCLQMHPDPVPAVSARNPGGADWMSAALSAGYAAAGAPSRAYALSSAPLPPQLFEALRRGWTLAEAWMLAQPFLRDGLQVVGDPLMTIGFPRAGYDVFGPADRVDQINLTQPIARLHAGQRHYALAGEQVPPEGGSRYLVQRLDGAGRADLASAAVFAGIEQGVVTRPALPAWPAQEAWRVGERGGGLVLSAFWPASLCALAVDQIQLQSQAGTDDPVLLEEVEPGTGRSRVRFSIDRPQATTRYRFRVVQGPATYDTPWSAWVAPAIGAGQPLTILEGQS